MLLAVKTEREVEKGRYSEAGGRAALVENEIKQYVRIGFAASRVDPDRGVEHSEEGLT
jgi:hypothetical protein